MCLSKRFNIFNYIIDVVFPKIEIKRKYKPTIYVFRDNDAWYWDFGRSFDSDSKSLNSEWSRKNSGKMRGHQLFGPFDSESEACVDWLKACKTHEYDIPWPVIHMGEVTAHTKNWKSIYGSWRTGIGHLD